MYCTIDNNVVYSTSYNIDYPVVMLFTIILQLSLLEVHYWCWSFYMTKYLALQLLFLRKLLEVSIDPCNARRYFLAATSSVASCEVNS